LLIDANAVLTCPVTLQRFETITRQAGQVLQRSGGVEKLKAFPALPFKSLKFTGQFSFGEPLRPPAPLAQDHFVSRYFLDV
jgi:hypothetical protein